MPISAADGDHSLSPFSAMVRDMRAASGESQATVSKRGQLSAGQLGMIERGQRGQRPHRDMVLRIARGLKATKEQRDQLLLAADHSPDSASPRAPAFVDAVNADVNLRADEKRVLLDLYGTMVRGR